MTCLYSYCRHWENWGSGLRLFTPLTLGCFCKKYSPFYVILFLPSWLHRLVSVMLRTSTQHISNLFCFQFTDNAENKCRQIILEIFNRFPNSDALKPCVFDMLKISLRVLMVDNEDNSLTALRIIFDLHKSFRPNLEIQVQVTIIWLNHEHHQCP